jgi:hypothetical protein
MTTYSIITNSGSTLGQKKTITEAMLLLPAGSKLVSGNKTEKIKKKGADDRVRVIEQATYRTPQQTYISIIKE